MRTTVDIEGVALERAKRLALREKRTLGSVVSDALVAYLSKRPPHAPDPPFELIVRGKPSGRFPSPDDFARVEEDEDMQMLGIRRDRRDAPA